MVVVKEAMVIVEGDGDGDGSDGGGALLGIIVISHLTCICENK